MKNVHKAWAAIAVALIVALIFISPPADAAREPADAPFATRAPTDADMRFAAGDVDPTSTQHPLAVQTQFQADREVVVPYGSWLDDLIGQFLSAIALGLAGLVAWGMRQIPTEIAGVLRTLRVEQLFDKAIQYGINATRDAVKDKTLTVAVGNEVLERAFEYAVRHAPGLLNKIGSSAFVREKIIARLNLEAAAAVPVPRPPAEQLIVERVVPPPVPVAAT